MTTETAIKREGEGKSYTVFVDGNELHVEVENLTVSEIKGLAGIGADVPLIEVHDDGTQTQLPDDEMIELKPGRRFKKAPRFVRG